MKLKTFGIIFIFVLSSCSTYKIFTLHKNTKPIEIQYPTMKTIIYENSKAYEFKNITSDVLLIVIEGSGWHSVLGWAENNQFQKMGMWPYIIEEFKDECSILVLEKLNFELGKYYEYNVEIREKYYLENLVKNYSETIDNYLSENNYSKIVLVGTSEGACVLPLVYKNIQNNKISGMVSIAYGGLSLYEQTIILADSKLEIPYYIKEIYQNIDIYKKDIELYPNSLRSFAGNSYIWWNSFFNYKPFDDYMDITIPILFVHGGLDTNVPVESTKYIQDNIQENPFTFLIYPDADHHSFLNSIETFKDFKNRSREWLYKL